jgi:uncharacterized membrane protein YkoI
MPVSRPVILTLLAGLLAAPALAADPQQHACLSKAEQRAAVAEHKAIPLAKAIKSRREKGHHAELVGARLCRHGDGLVYVLTLLGRSGKVVSETVDAASGELINEH